MPVRDVHVDRIVEAVARLSNEANCDIGEDIFNAVKKAKDIEQSDIGRDILDDLLRNYEVARNEGMPVCQDTGMAVVFIELGQDVHLVGGSLAEAVNAGVREGYRRGYLRCSVVGDPLERKNTGDNTPAVIHLELVPGDAVRITVAPKGFGSENMSSLAMLRPADGEEGLRRFVLETVSKAGANPCPPVVVGVGVGGTMEKAALLSKKALLRPIEERHSEPRWAQLERELLEDINGLGIGPQGLGGVVTALGVNIETYPTHIAGLPVAVNIGCHVTRHKSITL